jgi:hypothetical protein
MLVAMERDHSAENLSFSARLKMAFRLIFDAAFAREVQAGLRPAKAPAVPFKAKAPELPPERVHASGLLVLSALQREGRLIDFLQQEIAGFADEEVGAAARVVHTGCAKMLKQYLTLAPVLTEAEGATLTVPPGFDAQRIRLTGRVTGHPPFQGTLQHHGWVATEVRLPMLQAEMDPRIVAPAEVELP